MARQRNGTIFGLEFPLFFFFFYEDRREVRELRVPRLPFLIPRTGLRLQRFEVFLSFFRSARSRSLLPFSQLPPGESLPGRLFFDALRVFLRGAFFL